MRRVVRVGELSYCIEQSVLYPASRGCSLGMVGFGSGGVEGRKVDPLTSRGHTPKSHSPYLENLGVYTPRMSWRIC